MDKARILIELNDRYSAFAGLISTLSKDEFSFSLNGEKWTAGQQTDHLCRSVEPLNNVLKIPAASLKTRFGTAERPSMSYSDLVARYRQELAAGGTASEPFCPDNIEYSRKDEITTKLLNLVADLCTHIERYDDEDLDVLTLPHPLLGKLTLREMFCFTIYHAEHHHRLTSQNIDSRSATTN